MEKPFKSSIKNTENNGAKAPRKSYLETLIDRFRPKCNNTNESEPDMRRRVSRLNIETRLARLEELIQTLQKEICELTNQTCASYDELRRMSRDLTSSEGESGFSCTPCTLETVIVKDVNFTPARFSEIGRQISEIHRIFDLEASGSTTGRINNASIKLCDKTNSDNENGGTDDIDEIIFELRSEICNKLGFTTDLSRGRDLTNSREDLTKSSCNINNNLN